MREKTAFRRAWEGAEPSPAPTPSAEPSPSLLSPAVPHRQVESRICLYKKFFKIKTGVFLQLPGQRELKTMERTQRSPEPSIPLVGGGGWGGEVLKGVGRRGLPLHAEPAWGLALCSHIVWKCCLYCKGNGRCGAWCLSGPEGGPAPAQVSACARGGSGCRGCAGRGTAMRKCGSPQGAVCLCARQKAKAPTRPRFRMHCTFACSPCL